MQNILERRAPFREAHLALAKNYIDRGEIVLARVFSDPVDGAVLIFKVDDRSSIKEFGSKDPYTPTVK